MHCTQHENAAPIRWQITAPFTRIRVSRRYRSPALLTHPSANGASALSALCVCFPRARGLDWYNAHTTHARHTRHAVQPTPRGRVLLDLQLRVAPCLQGRHYRYVLTWLPLIFAATHLLCHSDCCQMLLLLLDLLQLPCTPPQRNAMG